MALWPACVLHADRHATADENAPYPLGGATHPQNWGAGGYFHGRREQSR